MEKYQCDNCADRVFYWPEFITEAEEELILNKVESAPKPKWTQLSHRRLQNWGGHPHVNGMIAEPLPPWLSKFVDKVNGLQLFDEGRKNANHVLVNEYRPGQGIMPHTDGPLFYPTVTTISCGSTTLLELEPRPGQLDLDGGKFSLLLERRSLVVLQDQVYTSYLHSISERDSDLIDSSVANIQATKFKLGDLIPRQTRISLTIRHVPKTRHIKLKIFNTYFFLFIYFLYGE